MGGLNPLLHGHQGCRDLGSLPGWLTSTIACQVCSAPGGTSSWGREQESGWLPLCLSNCPMSQPCRTLQHAGSFLPGIDGTGTNVPSIQPFTRNPPSGQVPASMNPSPPVPQHSPRHKQWLSSPNPVNVLLLSRTTSKATPEGSPSSKQWEMTSLDKALTPSCLEAFNWDSHLVRGMREEYFKCHSQNVSTENTHDLSEVSQWMIVAAELLGSSIYEVKEEWAGPDELWQANYALRTLFKGLNFLRAVSPSESPKVMGLTDIHVPDELCHFYKVNHWPWCRKEGQKRAQWSATSRWHIIGWALCAKGAMATHPPLPKPFATIARRTANPQGREVLMSHPHWHNHQQEVYEVNLS